MMSGHSNRRTGVALVETLLAVVILSLGAVAVLKAMTTAVTAAEIARDGLRGNALLREKLADWRLAAQSGSGVGPGSEEGTFSGVDAPYRWRLDQQRIASEGAVLEVSVAVWRADTPRRQALTTWQAVRPVQAPGESHF